MSRYESEAACVLAVAGLFSEYLMNAVSCAHPVSEQSISEPAH